MNPTRALPSLLLAILAACVEPVDAPPPDPGPDEPGLDDPADGEPEPDDDGRTALVLDDGASRRPGSGGGPCAVPPLGNFRGTGYLSDRGTGSGHSMAVTVEWTLVSTEGCVDRYDTTSGTASGDAWGWQCNRVRFPDSGPVEPGDGVLLIDRSAMPVRFVMRGSSSYPVVEYCEGDDDPEATYSMGGRWASFAGTFEGVASGGWVSTESGSHTGRWTLFRADATFTPPPAGACSEPPSEAWSTDTRYVDDDDVTAELQWTRVSTVGCVDTFAPSGLVRVAGGSSYNGTVCTVSPTSAPVDGTGDVLRIDRSTSPPTYFITGRTSWQATTTCTRADGTVTQHTGYAGGDWARMNGVFHGNQFSGAHGRHRWELRRL